MSWMDPGRNNTTFKPSDYISMKRGCLPGHTDTSESITRLNQFHEICSLGSWTHLNSAGVFSSPVLSPSEPSVPFHLPWTEPSHSRELSFSTFIHLFPLHHPFLHVALHMPHTHTHTHTQGLTSQRCGVFLWCISAWRCQGGKQWKTKRPEPATTCIW